MKVGPVEGDKYLEGNPNRAHVIDLVFRYGLISPEGILCIEPSVLRDISSGVIE